MPFGVLLAAAMVAIGASYATSIPTPRDQVVLAPQSPIYLAVGPRCRPLSGDTYADVNAGINPLQFKTIVSFGDSFTDGGKSDGSPLDPAIIYPPNPEAEGDQPTG